MAFVGCDDEQSYPDNVCVGGPCDDAVDGGLDGVTDGMDADGSGANDVMDGDDVGDGTTTPDSCTNEHDPSGTYFVSIFSGLQEDIEAPPIFFAADVLKDESGSLGITLQALSTDVDPESPEEPRENPRSPVGEPIVIEDVTFNADGSFETRLEDVMVPGAANPISGSDIVANLGFFGRSCDANQFCGTLDLELTDPLEVEADGTFGSVKVDDIGEAATSEPVTTCVDAGEEVSCDDGLMNGDEEGVDCGGSCDAVCPEPTCDDGVMNGDEEGVDCGGSCDAVCPEPTCDDGVMNGDEEGVDCGGSCEDECAAPTCDDGVMNGDEEGIDCGGSCDEVCEDAPTCDDGVMNGDEEGIDCGGSCDEACASCEDGVMNGDELGVDCGGSCADMCGTCDDGVTNGNERGVDCGGRCDDCPTCFDGEQNGDETGVDCGGSCGDCLAPGACNDPNSEACEACDDAFDDCFDACPLECLGGVLCDVADCRADCADVRDSCEGDRPTCDDGIRDGDEDGIDCGGSCPDVCPTCDDGIMNGNEAGVDCGGVCPDLCQADPTCSDGVMNGDEEGVDCGGSCPNDCDAGPTCSDGVMNGDEEGVDCGGSCPEGCSSDFPPSIESLYDPAGPACVLPNCDESGDAGFDPSGTWSRTLTNTRSNCSSSIVSQNATAGEGYTETTDVQLNGITGTCEFDHAGDTSIQTATIRNGIMAACDFNERTAGVVSYETSIIEFDGDSGSGMTRVYVTNVPGFLGDDCDFDLDVTYERQ